MAAIRVPRPADQRTVVAVVFVATMFLAIMDATIVNVALPSIATDLGTGTDSIDTVVTSYLVSLAVVIPASGWLADRFGARRVFLAALTVFTVASALCATAGDVGQLVGWRILQGVGGGLLTPVGTTKLYRVYPPQQRARAARVMMIPTAVAPALGPVLGGLLTDGLSWHWVFLVNVPLGLATLLYGLVFLADVPATAARGFDLVGFLLAAGGLAGILYAVSTGPSHGWGSPAVLLTGAAGLVATAAMIYWETRVPHPVLALEIMKNRIFRMSNLVMTFGVMAFMALLYLVPLLAQAIEGASSTRAGLLVFPEAVGVMIGSQVAGSLYPRIGPRRLLAGGLAAAAVTIGLFAAVTISASPWTLRTLMFLAGFAMSFVFLSTQTAAFATITPMRTGDASALFNAQRQLASAFGVALVATVLALPDAGSAAAGAFARRWVFLVPATLALVGAVLALFIRDADASATMRSVAQRVPTSPGTGPDGPVPAKLPRREREAT
ncbi:DHA2 family efflux MFS transporter permease subunit [Frankia sp. AvcI1]|uniref:DHA2 family efflux MFS transporter permease subunit n=1 Tax=Frankia sp. AvcI1 TaxID=573496 RepID=UPI002118FDA4|nr:DHA2 family efflux MFS transporter permease subunit [Frankia sp. AvcI1]